MTIKEMWRFLHWVTQKGPWYFRQYEEHLRFLQTLRREMLLNQAEYLERLEIQNRAHGYLSPPKGSQPGRYVPRYRWVHD